MSIWETSLKVGLLGQIEQERAAEVMIAREERASSGKDNGTCLDDKLESNVQDALPRRWTMEQELDGAE